MSKTALEDQLACESSIIARKRQKDLMVGSLATLEFEREDSDAAARRSDVAVQVLGRSSHAPEVVNTVDSEMRTVSSSLTSERIQTCGVIVLSSSRVNENSKFKTTGGHGKYWIEILLHFAYIPGQVTQSQSSCLVRRTIVTCQSLFDLCRTYRAGGQS